MSQAHPSTSSIFLKFYTIPLLLILGIFFLSACSSGSLSGGDSSLGALPKHWSKYLSVGSIGAVLNVYDEQGTMQTTQDLTIDKATGEVHSAQFKLPIGGDYRFVVVFNYQLTPNDLIPYAYADFNWLVDEFSEAVAFSENDIRYDFDSQDPSISADLSDGKIPNLDLDGDDWSNWEELRDKVNPKDSKSVPILPTISVTGQQDGSANTATLTLIAKDNAHVEELKLLDPLCGVTVLSDTQIINVDGSMTRTLVLRLDLLSIRDGQSSRGMLALTNDGVTPVQNASGTVNFNVSGTASQPYFVFVQPAINDEIEDFVAFQGIACSRYDLDLAQTRFLNPEIASFRFTSQRNPQTGDYDVESEAVDTTLLPDGLVTLQVELEDVTNKTGQGSGTFKVVNDNQIKIVSPVGRRWVFGNEQIAITLKNQSANLVVIEGNSNFSLSSSTSGGAVGVLKVGNLPEGSIIPLTFKAVLLDGSEIVRSVDFNVRNKPQIKSFAPHADTVFQGWKTNFSYKIANVDPNSLLIEGQSTAAAGQRTCSNEPSMPGITSCEGDFPVLQTKSSGNEMVDLSASRLPTAEEVCLNCVESQVYELKSGGALSYDNDIPTVNVAIDGDDEPVAPEKFVLPTNPAGKVYQMILENLWDETLQDFGEKPSGSTYILNGLEARSDYRATLQTLSGPGGNLISEIFKDVTTGDIGLVGWWRFNQDPNGPVCAGGTSGETVCDYSGRNNHGKPFGGGSYLPPSAEFLDGALGFDGVDDYVNVDNSTSLNFGSSTTLSLEIRLNPKSFSSWIFGKGSGGGHGNYSLVVGASGYIGFTFDSNSHLPMYDSNFLLNINEISHIVMSHTFGNGSLIKMKINGNNVPGFWRDSDSDPGVTGSEQPITNSDQLTFGRRTLLAQDYFEGIFDEIIIYNRVLSDMEMDEHFQHFTHN